MSDAAIRLQTNRPKNRRAVRALKDKAPKVIEDAKKQLLLRGTKTSPIMNQILKDLHKLKQPQSVMLPRRTERRPFEDFESVKFLSDKNDCTLFSFCSSNKKRPNNLIFGRLFDYQLLDMYEFGVDDTTYLSTDAFESVVDPKSATPGDKSFVYGSKPGLLFQGEAFQNDMVLKELKPFFVDYFNGETLKSLNLITFDHILVFTAVNLDEVSTDKQEEYKLNPKRGNIMLLLRHYKVEYQRSSHNKLPFVHLKEIGPSMDLRLRRFEKGNDEVTTMSQRSVQKNTLMLNKKPKKKNVFLDKVFKERRGKIYIQQSDQNLDRLKTKKMKPLRDRDRSKNPYKITPKKKKNSNNKKVRMRTNQL